MLKKSVCIVLAAVMILSCSSCAQKSVYDYSRDNNTFKIGNTVITNVITDSFPRDNDCEPLKIRKKVFHSFFEYEQYIYPLIQKLNDCNEDDRERLQQQFYRYTPEWFKNHILYYDLLEICDSGTLKLKRAERAKKNDGKQIFEMDVCYTPFPDTYYSLSVELDDSVFIELDRNDVKGISDDDIVLNIVN